MNFFEFYDIPVSFTVDERKVREKYIELSRKYHPDFYASEPDDKQQEMLRLSTMNTQAFHILSDFDKRMKYVLELKNLIHEGERYDLSKDFLMEMLEINESLMELKAEPDAQRLNEMTYHVDQKMASLGAEIAERLKNYNDAASPPQVLQQIKDYYFKKKYLLRIKESLDTFGDSQ